MARLKDLALARGGDSYLFDPEQIDERPGYNVRDMDSPETQAHIRKMVDAIHAGGTSTFPPITITQEDGKIYVIAGYCRRRAFILAKTEGAPIKGILAIANTQKEDERTLDLLNSNDGLPLTPLEKAKAVQRLISFQWTSSEIARRRGVSLTSIQNLLLLLDAPAEVVKMVSDGKVSATLAVNTVRQEGPIFAGGKLQEAVETAKKEGKPRATAKHMPKPVTSAGVNWFFWGPKLKAAIEAIRDADTNSERFDKIEAASLIISEINPK